MGGVVLALDFGINQTDSILKFGSDVVYGLVREWHLEQIRPFLENPDATGPSLVTRYYPRVSRRRELSQWQSRQLDYGVLEIFALRLAQEWITFPGHVHKGPGRTLLPAVAEVLHGEGGLLLQGLGLSHRQATIVWLTAQDRVFLPPGYAHAFINRGGVPFIVAEVHSSSTVVEYADIARHRGMAHYFGPDGSRPNPHYRGEVALRELPVNQMATPDISGRDLYQTVMRSAERFRFLHPF